MKRFPARLAVLVAALVVPSSVLPPLGSAVAAAASPGRVSGVARDETGAVLAGATVRLSTPSGPVAGHDVTGADGRYTIAVDEGLYDVTVAATDAIGPWTAHVKNMPVWSDTPLDLAVVRPGGPVPTDHVDPASAFGAGDPGASGDAAATGNGDGTGTGDDPGGAGDPAPGVTWNGRVLGPDGTPVEPRSIRVDPTPGGPTGTLQAGPGGAFTFTGPAGAYALGIETGLGPWGGGSSAGPDEGLFLAGAVDLTGNRSDDLTLPSAATVNVVVADINGPKRREPLAYSAVADTPAGLAPGVTARATIRATIAADDAHYHPLLAGPSALTFTVPAGPAGEPVPVTAPVEPGDRLAIVIGDRTTPPGAPQDARATAADGKIKVSWDRPATDGGSPVTAYVVTASHERSNFKATFPASATSGTVRNLVPGAYEITVTARNSKGSGPASTPVTVALDGGGDGEPADLPAGGDGDPGGPLGGAGSDGDGTGAPPPAGSERSGYWLLGADGAVYAFGDAAPLGDASAALASAGGASGGNGGTSFSATPRAVDLAPAPSGAGYWVLDSRGRVHPFGDAPRLGDVLPGRLDPGEEPASLSATPSGAGYWVFTNRGRVLAFGDAPAVGDVAGRPLNGPVLDSVATPSGRGYYMVAADGGIFAFGDARFAGSMGGRALNAPVRSLVPDGDGDGYWLVAGDGGIFAFDAPFRGSMGGQRLNGPVRGMVRYGHGYVMVAEDGGVFAFSDRPFTGALGTDPPASPVVSVAALGS